MGVIAGTSPTTVGAMLDRVLGTLEGSRRINLNRLDGAVAAVSTDTDVAVRYDIGGWSPGTVMEVGRELMYVWDVKNRPSRVSTVQRGFRGTTPAAHADGAQVKFDPVWTRQQAFDALLAEIRDLNGSSLRGHAVATVASTASSPVYDLPAGTVVRGIVSASWPGAHGQPVRARWRFSPATDVDPASFVLLDHGNVGSPLTVTYAVDFEDFTDESDVLGTACHVPSLAEEAMRYGAALRLLPQQEAARIDIEAVPSNRPADDVPVTSYSRLAEQLHQMRERSLARAIAQQTRLYPITQRT
jgi:hypothetical protein